MEETDFVNAFDGFEDLQAQTQAGRQREGAPRLGPPQFGQVAPLQLHHHIVEPVVPAAADETAHVFLACNDKFNPSIIEADSSY